MAEKRIGKHVYKFEEILGWDAVDLAELLIDVIAPFSDVVSTMVTQRPEDKDRGDKLILDAFSHAIKSRNSQATRQLMEALLGKTYADGEPCVPGVKPASLEDMIAVTLWAAEVQFGRFFDVGVLKKLSLTEKKTTAP